MSLIIPRLTKEEERKVKINQLQPVTMLCCKGPKKPVPPEVASCNQGDKYAKIVARTESVRNAVENDTCWLVNTIRGDIDGNNTVDWSGYNFAISREKGRILKGANYIFGPLINETPSHPDAVLATMVIVEDFAQKTRPKVHLS